MSGAVLAPRDNRLPAMALAVLLHAGVLALVILVPSKSPPAVGSSVPINIVSSEPTNTRPAVQAPVAQAAAAPAPTPTAPPQPPAPVPAPTPAFSRTIPRPAPAPPPRPVPAQPSTHAVAAPAPAVDFNRLQQIIDNARRNAGATASSAQRGPARAETAPQARPDAGKGLSQSDLLGLQQLLERLWNPNCDVAGSQVKLRVRFVVDLSGGLLGSPEDGKLEYSSDPVVSVAARRALDAVREAAPYSQPYYGQTITVNFDAKEACAKR